MKIFRVLPIVIFAWLCISINAQEQKVGASSQELAKQLSNPVSNLISVPFQNNFDFNVGPNKGFNYTLNLQPVIPVSIAKNWNLISRTIVPVISQNNVYASGESEFGLGDVAQSLFFSPKQPTKGGILYGIGPVLLLPTATNDLLGIKKWGIGPTAVILRMQGNWTYGALINQIWSYAGSGNSDVSITFFQPFISYSTSNGMSYSFNSENTQNWNDDMFRGFASVIISKVTQIDKQSIQFGLGPKMFYGNNLANPEWGIRVIIVLLFPK